MAIAVTTSRMRTSRVRIRNVSLTAKTITRACAAHYAIDQVLVQSRSWLGGHLDASAECRRAGVRNDAVKRHHGVPIGRSGQAPRLEEWLSGRACTSNPPLEPHESPGALNERRRLREGRPFTPESDEATSVAGTLLDESWRPQRYSNESRNP